MFDVLLLVLVGCWLQVLNRLAFASTLSHLRRINSPIGERSQVPQPVSHPQPLDTSLAQQD